MPRILLIDDDDVFRKMASVMLVTAGYDVEEAADGAAGVACYRRKRADVVIADIVMPHKEGLETIKELRRVRSRCANHRDIGRGCLLSQARHEVRGQSDSSEAIPDRRAPHGRLRSPCRVEARVTPRLELARTFWSMTVPANKPW